MCGTDMCKIELWLRPTACVRCETQESANPNLVTEGFSDDGTMTFRMKGLFAEVFDNLQVSEDLRDRINNLPLCVLYDYLMAFFYCRIS
jgi:hypothetical protein